MPPAPGLIPDMQVFISHAAEDKEFARKIAADLRANGVDIWIAPDSILAGEDWVSAINRGLSTSTCIVIVLTPSAIASRWVRTEVNTAIMLAHEGKIEIIPLNIIPAELPALWAGYQKIMEFADGYAAGLKALTTRLSTNANKIVAGSPLADASIRLANDLAELKQQLDEELHDRDMSQTAYQIASTIIIEGAQVIARKTHPKLLAKSLLQSFDRISRFLAESTRPVEREEISRLAFSASGDTEIADVICICLDKVGRDGPIVAETGQRELTLEIIEGLQFDRGYITPDFLTDPETLKAIVEAPLILLANQKLTQPDELNLLAKKLVEISQPNLLIIAEYVEPEVLDVLLQVKRSKGLNVLAVGAPGFGDNRQAMLEDIAILTGGRVFREHDLTNATIDDLGKADKVIATENSTMLIGCRGDRNKIKARVSELRRQIAETTSDYAGEKLRGRLTKLVTGVARILVGGRSDKERKEKLKLVNRALTAVQAGIISGYVPGQNIVFANVAFRLRQQNPLEETERQACRILVTALEMPLKNNVEAVGRNGDAVLDAVRSKQREQGNLNIGYDSDLDEVVDLVKAGIISPSLIAELIARNAVERAARMLSKFSCTDDIIRHLGG